MSPLEIKMLLHYYAMCEPWDDKSPAVNGTRSALMSDGLICISEDSGSGFTTTKRGDVLVDMLLSTPLPEWGDPRGTDEST